MTKMTKTAMRKVEGGGNRCRLCGAYVWFGSFTMGLHAFSKHGTWAWQTLFSGNW